MLRLVMNALTPSSPFVTITRWTEGERPAIPTPDADILEEWTL